MSDGRKIKWALGILIGAVIIVGLGAVVAPQILTDGQEAVVADKAQTVLPVNVAPVNHVDSYTKTRTYTGTVRARSRSDLAFELSGTISSILVDEGDQVKKGQTLATLDTASLSAQRGAMLAAQDQATALLSELQEGPRVETIRAARSTYEAAQSDYKNAVADHDRRKKLFEINAISSEEYDRAQFAMQSASSRMHAAEQQLQELQAGTRSEKIAAQKAAVAQSNAAIKELDVAMQKSQLVAPFDGIVTRRYLDLGSVAPASNSVVRLVENQHLEAWIGLPNDKSSQIKIGDSYSVVCGTDTFSATAQAKIAELDQTTRTQTVVFKLPGDAHSKLVSGQLCQIEISSTIESSGFWVPTSSLARGVRGLWSVMTIQSAATHHVVEKQDVDVIYTDGRRALVRGPLTNGDLIVVDGLHRIVTGQRVSISEQPVAQTAENSVE